MSNSVQPHRWQATRLPNPWDSPAKNTAVGYHFLLQCMKVKGESEIAQSCLTLTAAYQAPPSTGFSRQEYWSEVPLPSQSKQAGRLQSQISVCCQQLCGKLKTRTEDLGRSAELPLTGLLTILASVIGC